MNRSLDQWVDYIQTLHHREIELSLERVRQVYLRMYPDGLPFKILSLSGTNGKGSTAELLASIYRAGGYRVGKFTSPHLVRFNERFDLNGEPVDDASLLDAFDRVEASRLDTPITFFEYGTLLAIELFAKSGVDVAVMEVGLGGRLDSVNILDADISIVTSISIDHTSWLGNTLEEIAYEKAGIAREGRPLVLGVNSPPESMLSHANEIGAKVELAGREFNYAYTDGDRTWEWSSHETKLSRLPLPYGQAGVQLSNCSLAIQAVQLLSGVLPVRQADIHDGIQAAKILGRCQVFSRDPDIIFDVSHNETSVARLAKFLTTLRSKPLGRIVAVCGMLRDKEIGSSLEQISGHVDQWHLATIHNERGATAAEVASEISSLSSSGLEQYDRVTEAYDTALKTLTTNDCLVVFGSFHIVGDILDHLNR